MDSNAALANRVALLERQLDELRRAGAEEHRNRKIKAEVKQELRKRRETQRRRLRDVAAVLGGVAGLGVMIETLFRTFV